MTYYNWIYTTSNENAYILFLIIVILIIIIVNFNLWKKKTDKFDNKFDDKFDDISNDIYDDIYDDIDISNITTPQNIVDELLALTPEQIEIRKRLLNISNSNPYDIDPITTQFDTDNKPTFNNVTEPQINRYLLSYGISKLDGDQESIIQPTNTQNSNNTNINDIMQSKSSLYTSILTGKSSFQASNYAKIGDYATLDSLGSSMTDTLGGIKSNLGYTLLDEQLGTFTPKQQNNPYTYDNTANFHTGMNPHTVDGASCVGSGYGGNGSPIFLQKDFTGVANIFAPNIIIANPPLTDDGLPDISFKM